MVSACWQNTGSRHPRCRNNKSTPEGLFNTEDLCDYRYIQLDTTKVAMGMRPPPILSSDFSGPAAIGDSGGDTGIVLPRVGFGSGKKPGGGESRTSGRRR